MQPQDLPLLPPDPSATVPSPPAAQPSLGAGSPPAPTGGLAAPPRTPPITPDAKLAERRPADKISNPFERTATLIVDGAESAAKSLAGSLNEEPADSVEGDPQTVHEMLHFSKYGTDAPRQYWRLHDQILAEAVAANDPDPYAAAERGALDEVYPYRAKLALLDVLGPDEKVQRAEYLMRLSQAQQDKGHTPDRMPFHVGPAGLKPEDAVMPGQEVQPRQQPPPESGGSY